MEEVISGIVLGGVNYRENDKILNVFTLEKGIVSARIKGVKKAGAKLKFASEPFCFAEFVFLKSGDKRTVIGASLTDSFYPLREDIKRYYSAAAAAEFVKAFSKEGILSPDLFVALAEVLKTLAYSEENSYSALARFFVKSLVSVGYGLNLEGCVCCGEDIEGRTFFDYNSGGFLCKSCFNGNGREINNVTYRALYSVYGGESVDRTAAVFALRLIDYYLVNKTETTLKSLKELLLLP